MLNRNYMLKRHNINSGKLKVELDLSNYETKTDLKNRQELISHLLLKRFS